MKKKDKNKNGQKFDDSKLPYSLEKCEYIINRRNTIQFFWNKTSKLCAEEMTAFHNNFDEIWDEVIYPEIYRIASNAIEEDLNTYLLESGQLDRVKRGTLSPRELTVPQKAKRIQNAIQAKLLKMRARQKIREAVNIH